ncbi:MAG: hypothetical protein WB822_07730, partial [Rhodoplanes sp.]
QSHQRVTSEKQNPRRLSVYTGHLHIGTLTETARGWLAHDADGRGYGCHRSQLDAMRALP